MDKIWSVEEANSVLPHLREVLPVLLEDRQRAELARHALVELEDRMRGDGEGLGGELERRRHRLREAMAKVRQGIQQVRRLGCEVKDLDLGLVDFPSEMDGRPVFLCWRLDEPAVEYWHSQSDGYAGRRRLADASRPDAGP